VILISCDFYFLITPFIMDFSQLSEENYDIELSKVFAKIDKIVSQKGEARKRVFDCSVI
jgi:hypothetical protein